MKTISIVIIAVAVAFAVGLSTVLISNAMWGPSNFGLQSGFPSGQYSQTPGQMMGQRFAGGMMGVGYGYGGSMMGPGGMMGGGMMNSGYAGYCGQYMGNYTMGRYWNYSGAGGPMVAIVNYAFAPSNITISKGTTVTWVNMDFVQHTVTSGTEQAPTNLFDSHELNHMQSFSYTFNTPGTYIYYCDVHPDMIGMITVLG